MFTDEKRRAVRAAFIIMSFVALSAAHLLSTAASVARSHESPLGSRPQKGTQSRVAPKRRANYSQFSHATHVLQQKLACDSCHKFPTKNWNEVRKGSAAFPDVSDFPEHSACLTCHRAQFFARERPAPDICSNCHVNVTPRDTPRFLFPSLDDIATAGAQTRDFASEFQVSFPHDKHLDVVSFNAPDNSLNV